MTAIGMLRFEKGRVTTSLALLSIYLIPLVGLIDVAMSIGILPGMVDRSRTLHPFPAIVVVREVVVVLLFLVLISKCPETGRIPKLLFRSVFLLMPLLLYSTSVPAFLGGIRQILYLVYIPIGFSIYNYALKANIDINLRISRALKFLLIVECVCALLQTQLMPAVEGRLFFGSRAYGTFNNPNTLGVFGAISLPLLIHFSGKRSLHWIYGAFALMIVIAAASRTGLVLLGLACGWFLLTRLRSPETRGFAGVATLGIIICLVVSLNVITNRGAYPTVWNSVRLNNVRRYLTEMDILRILIGNGWGVLTSWYYGLGGDIEVIGGIGGDSFYAAMLIQIGLIGLMFLLIWLFSLFSLAGNQGLLLFIVFCLTGLQVNVLEYYPMNLLIFLSLGIFIGERRKWTKRGKSGSIIYSR